MRSEYPDGISRCVSPMRAQPGIMRTHLVHAIEGQRDMPSEYLERIGRVSRFRETKTAMGRPAAGFREMYCCW